MSTFNCIYFCKNLRKPLFIRVSELKFIKKNKISMTYIAKMRKFDFFCIIFYNYIVGKEIKKEKL